MKRHIRWVSAALAITLVATFPMNPVSATKISDVKNKRQQSEKKLNDTKQKISDIQSSQSTIENELDSLDDELVEIITSISSLEQDLKDTQKKLEKTQVKYEKAKKEEERQYEDMKERIQYLYESGDAGYLAAFLKAESFTDMINKVEYAQQLYETDRSLLDEYQDTKEKVVSAYKSIQNDKANLEEAKAQCADQKKSLQTLIDKKKKQSSAFAQELALAEKEAKQFENEIAAAKNEEERIRARERQRQAVARAIAKRNAEKKANSNNNNSVDLSSPSVSPSDSGTRKPSDPNLGQQIVNYATQFIGNPYVFGGNSMTNGIDCSGFTQQVFAHFGISLPRSSGAQRSSGYGVAYSEAQPGDLICYSGHVAIYMGGGRIVHASNSRPYPAGGIKISNDATYRQILAVRRCY